MATQRITLTGIIEWAHHLFQPDEFEGVKRWKVNFYPDPESMEKLQAAGTKKKLKSGPYGGYYTLTRETERVFKKEEGLVQLSPPDVQDAEGQPWPDDKSIGNGSRATVRLEIYDAGRFRGTRLLGVRIDDLVEYERPETDEARPF